MARLISLIENTYGIQILGSYATYGEFIAEHPTGNPGDAYIIDGNIYTWGTTSETWIDGGQIVGPQGQQGIPGPQGIQGIQGPPGQDAPLPLEVTFTVQGGTTGPGAVQPTFSGAPLFIGSYVKTGPLISFQIQVNFDNILTFGTGQYYLNLPFVSKYAYQFRSGALIDPVIDRQWSISGGVLAGSNMMKLFYAAPSDRDEAFDYNSPHLLDSSNDFYISGAYIDDEA